MQTEIPKLYRQVFARHGLVAFLKIFDKTAVLLVGAGYAAAVIQCAVGSLTELAKLLAATVIPFVGISLFRRLFNAPRPYELYDLCELFDSREMKRGRSFPSRHVASAFLIGSSVCFINPIIGVSAMILGIGLGACRVLLAKHFVRDVVAGGAMGGILGCVGMLILNVSFS